MWLKIFSFQFPLLIFSELLVPYKIVVISPLAFVIRHRGQRAERVKQSKRLCDWAYSARARVHTTKQQSPLHCVCSSCAPHPHPFVLHIGKKTRVLTPLKTKQANSLLHIKVFVKRGVHDTEHFCVFELPRMLKKNCP